MNYIFKKILSKYSKIVAYTRLNRAHRKQKRMNFIFNKLLAKYFKIVDYVRLSRIHRKQKKRFIQQSKKVNSVFLKSNSLANNNFVHDTWKSFSQNIEKDIIPKVKIDFFHRKSLLETMTSDGYLANHNGFLKEIKNQFTNKEIKELLQEELIGVPTILRNCKIHDCTSLNRIVHLYQASLCQKCVGGISEISVVTEWGGGYGGLADVIYKYSPNITYNIIDIPISSTIQWLYLTSVFGEESVNLINEKNKNIQTGKINLIPIGFASDVSTKLNCDLFISSWALSESDEKSQEFVLKTKLFSSSHGVIIYQGSSDKHPYAEEVKNLVLGLGVHEAHEDVVPEWNTEKIIYW